MPHFRRTALAIAAACAALPLAAFAMGGASGPKTTYETQGHLGEIIVNPYKVAPLTAVIRNGGYVIEKAKVTVLPKAGGIPISYDVSRRMLLTHGGIPVFGLYADYVNKVRVEYTRVFNGKAETFDDTTPRPCTAKRRVCASRSPLSRASSP